MDAQSFPYTHGPMTTAGTATDKAATIADEFGFALTDLHGVIGELTVRLQPILRPLGPEMGDPTDPMPPVSEIRDKLNSLHYASGELRRVIDRLDV